MILDDDIKIIVATHKKYKMPNDDMYLPIQVGRAINKKIEEYQSDNEKENISNKNPYFCELTGLYWAWKNIDANYIGLSHYRRHFSMRKIRSRNYEKNFKYILSKKETKQILKETDIILPKKRNYYIENLYSHYEHTMHIEPLN